MGYQSSRHYIRTQEHKKEEHIRNNAVDSIFAWIKSYSQLPNWLSFVLYDYKLLCEYTPPRGMRQYSRTRCKRVKYTGCLVVNVS